MRVSVGRRWTVGTAATSRSAPRPPRSMSVGQRDRPGWARPAGAGRSRALLQLGGVLGRGPPQRDASARFCASTRATAVPQAPAPRTANASAHRVPAALGREPSRAIIKPRRPAGAPARGLLREKGQVATLRMPIIGDDASSSQEEPVAQPSPSGPRDSVYREVLMARAPPRIPRCSGRLTPDDQEPRSASASATAAPAGPRQAPQLPLAAGFPRRRGQHHARPRTTCSCAFTNYRRPPA